MFGHGDVLYLAAAGIDLDGIELLDCMCGAHDYKPDVYPHYVILDNRCPAATAVSDAYDSGLIAVFGPERAMVILDCPHVAEVHFLN